MNWRFNHLLSKLNAGTQSGWLGISRLISVLGLSLFLGACSTVGSIKSGAGATMESFKAGASDTIDVISVKTNLGNNPRDPLEGFNRVMFNFNDGVDEYLLKPSAEVYRSVLPSFVQTAFGNFFGNAGDIWTAANNVMQGKLADGVNDVMRVVFNTTLGLGGVIDIASAAGMPKHREDFGQTLGRWGVPSGPYVVLPLLGASTLRDTIATPVDFKGDFLFSKTSVSVRNTTTVLRFVDRRASVLDAGRLIEEAALDKYVFIRDAYLQRRAGQINPDDD
jgi:phospholipid-binding lipoprotein MlaA